MTGADDKENAVRPSMQTGDAGSAGDLASWVDWAKGWVR
jgi:hypothetical protein